MEQAEDEMTRRREDESGVPHRMNRSRAAWGRLRRMPLSVTRHRVFSYTRLLIGVAVAVSCSNGPAAVLYAARTRDVTITTVPILTKEIASVYPFVKEDMAKGGVLDGDKEVYAFEPNTITVVEGDTIQFTFINPTDDVHGFVLPDFAQSLKGQSTTHATYVARKRGIYPFTCTVVSHKPMMNGTLVVLAPSAVQ